MWGSVLSTVSGLTYSVASALVGVGSQKILGAPPTQERFIDTVMATYPAYDSSNPYVRIIDSNYLNPLNDLFPDEVKLSILTGSLVMSGGYLTGLIPACLYRRPPGDKFKEFVDNTLPTARNILYGVGSAIWGNGMQAYLDYGIPPLQEILADLTVFGESTGNSTFLINISTDQMAKVVSMFVQPDLTSLIVGGSLLGGIGLLAFLNGLYQCQTAADDDAVDGAIDPHPIRKPVVSTTSGLTYSIASALVGVGSLKILGAPPIQQYFVGVLIATYPRYDSNNDYIRIIDRKNLNPLSVLFPNKIELSILTGSLVMGSGFVVGLLSAAADYRVGRGKLKAFADNTLPTARNILYGVGSAIWGNGMQAFWQNGLPPLQQALVGLTVSKPLSNTTFLVNVNATQLSKVTNLFLQPNSTSLVVGSILLAGVGVAAFSYGIYECQKVANAASDYDEETHLATRSSNDVASSNGSSHNTEIDLSA